MVFRLSDIVPREHGAWAILLVPYFAGTFAKGIPGIPALLLLISILSLYLLRGCGDFYISNLIKKKESYKNLNRFFSIAITLFLFFLISTVLLLFNFQRWNLLFIGIVALLLFGFYFFTELSKRSNRTNQQLLALLGLTLSAPAAYYVTSGSWDRNVLTLWILSVMFFHLGFLYVQNKISLHKSRRLNFKMWDKLLFSGNLIGGWCFSMLVFYCLFIANFIPSHFLIIFIPPALHVIVGIFLDKNELSIRRMGYIQVGQDIFFLIILICLFRNYSGL